MLGQFGESGWVLAQLCQQFGGTQTRLVALGRRRIFACSQQNVAGASLFVAGKACRVLLVVGFDVLGAHGQACLDRFQIQHHVLNAGLLRGLEQTGVVLIKLLDVGLGQVDLAEVVGAVEACNTHFTLFMESRQGNVGDRTR